MIAWAYLFLPPSWRLTESQAPPLTSPSFFLRLYNKNARIDERIPLFFSSPEIEGILQSHLARSVLLFPSRTIVQMKPLPQNTPHSPSLFWIHATHDSYHLWMGFSSPFLQSVVHLLSGKPTTCHTIEKLCSEITHWFSARLGSPPPAFEDYLLNLSDRDLQWLLQWLLSQKILSPAMLGAYIASLEQNAQRILANLSPRLREEVYEHFISSRKQKSYRWIDEVKYLVHHNLFQHPWTLAPKVHLLALYAELKSHQTHEDLQSFLQLSQGWHTTIQNLPPSIREKRYTAIPTKDIAAYGSFIDEPLFLSWWENIISSRGVSILQEERRWWLSQDINQRSLHAMQFLKAWFSLEAEEIPPSSMETALSLLHFPWQIELITQEIGVATLIYALKESTISHDILPTMILHMLEDIRKGILSFQQWGNYRIPQAQRRFLSAIYVLKHINRL